MDKLQKINPDDQAAPEHYMSVFARAAADPNCDPAKMREILSVKKDWEADEARKAFAIDMANFQSRCPIISKADNANGKMYARIDRIHRETRPLRSECGFWFVWASCEIKDGIACIDGVLGHRGGHTIPCRQVIPLPDEIITREGKKVTNSTQRAGSAMTYAKRYGECLALGIVTGEDDDGNAVRQKPTGPALDKEPTMKDLATVLWNLLKPLLATEPDWTGKDWACINNYLWREELLDGAVPELMPNLHVERLKKLIEDVKNSIG